jgi:hypothetical protein
VVVVDAFDRGRVVGFQAQIRPFRIREDPDRQFQGSVAVLSRMIVAWSIQTGRTMLIAPPEPMV